VPTDYTTEAPCTRESAILDTRPMRTCVWQTADTIISLYRSSEPPHDCFSEDGAGSHVRSLDDGPFRWLLSCKADLVANLWTVKVQVYLRAPPTTSIIAHIVHNRSTLLPTNFSLTSTYLNRKTNHHNSENHIDHQQPPTATINLHQQCQHQHNGCFTERSHHPDRHRLFGMRSPHRVGIPQHVDRSKRRRQRDRRHR